MIKIRFNLMRGKNFKKWAIYEDGEKTYIDPEKYNLTLINCTLKNNFEKAKKIFEGQNKDICAWIECEKIIKSKKKTIDLKNRIRYNPKINPFWTNCKEQNIDGFFFEKIVTFGKQLGS
ncbi:MAG: hypothetical protein EKK64_09880 [Neisseriaceae bacterium]|nr:MAG: hypothetical protein EKK64_09880 [Neisseriaceae bacterium]